MDIVAVGDKVSFDRNDDGSGKIETIHERRNYLSRKAPKIKGANKRGERLEQIVATNVDNLILVTSTVKPNFNNKLVDRIIVSAESSHINVVLVINKIDLKNDEETSFWMDVYRHCGYKVVATSAIDNIGIEELRGELNGNVSVFWGQSGVGKSSLLNVLYPELDFRIGEISEQTNKGTHTTVTSIMKEVNENTKIVDTPGIREIEPFGIQKHDLGHYFNEFHEYLNDCKFNTCTHFHEPGCAVRDAVEENLISIERYESYLSLLDTIEDDMFF